MRTSMDENLLRARTGDLADQCDHQHRVTQTCFLTPAELTIARAAAKRSGVSFHTFGGYEEAERQILLFVPDYLAGSEPDWDQYLHVLTIAASREGLEHRDYLGAILALGMRRDQIGDILVSEKSAQIVLLAGISEYISLNMERIGTAKVKITKEPLSALAACVSDLLTIRGNVPSLRLDNVASEGFSLSRSQITDLIRGGQVNLNYVQEQRPDHILKPGDLISLRGFGRLRFVSIDGKSKKDRFIITMEKTR